MKPARHCERLLNHFPTHTYFVGFFDGGWGVAFVSTLAAGAYNWATNLYNNLSDTCVLPPFFVHRLDVIFRECIEKQEQTEDGCVEPDGNDKNTVQQLFGDAVTLETMGGTACACTGDLCNGQQVVSAERLCWLVGLLLIFSAGQLWWIQTII